MKIGIIGAGNIGGTLTRRLTKLGHEVSVANSRGPASLSGLARETGARAVTASEAAHAGQVVIVTIPEGKIPALPRNLFGEVPDDVVVVDTGNYYPQRDGRIREIEEGMAESRWVEKQLNRSVIKAFNNIYAKDLLNLGRAPGDPQRLALPVAGDDENAKRTVMRLVDDLGFDPIDAGGVDDSWRQQPDTPVYGPNLSAEGVRQGLAQAKRIRG